MAELETPPTEPTEGISQCPMTAATRGRRSS
jgi:hypothetical protein